MESDRSVAGEQPPAPPDAAQAARALDEVIAAQRTVRVRTGAHPWWMLLVCGLFNAFLFFSLALPLRPTILFGMVFWLSSPILWLDRAVRTAGGQRAAIAVRPRWTVVLTALAFGVAFVAVVMALRAAHALAWIDGVLAMLAGVAVALLMAWTEGYYVRRPRGDR